MTGFSGSRPSLLWFDLKLMNDLEDWRGKLIVRWPAPERSWWRWSSRNEIPVQAIVEDSLLDSTLPDWRDIVLSWDELAILPRKWREALSQWRGIYFIHDTTDGKGYVGSACGEENILGRWKNYAASGHGGNKRLLERSPKNFQFSILERASPDLDIADVVRLEKTWKDRLATRISGLNEN
jgi:hypothetical protein